MADNDDMDKKPEPTTGAPEDFSSHPGFKALDDAFEKSLATGDHLSEVAGNSPLDEAGSALPASAHDGETTLLHSQASGQDDSDAPDTYGAAGAELDSDLAMAMPPEATAGNAGLEPKTAKKTLPDLFAAPEGQTAPAAVNGDDTAKIDDNSQAMGVGQGAQEDAPEVSAESSPQNAVNSADADVAEALPAATPKKGLFGKGKNSKDKDAVKGESAKNALPRLASPVTADATVLSRVYNTLSWGCLLVLTAVFLLQTLPGLQHGRLLWFSDELRQADVLLNLFNGDWLRLYLNGELYQEAPPFYFWFLAGLHKLLSLANLNLGQDYCARLLFAGTAVSGLLFLWASLLLARLVANLDRRGCFAAGCVLLGSLSLMFLFNYSNLDLFFGAFIIFAHVFLYKALLRNYAPLYMALAFACAAVALMTKGALGLALPLTSAIVFSIWQGRPQRLLKADFLLGVVFALLPVLLWLGNIWAAGDHEIVMRMLKEQVWNKAFGDAPRNEPWWYYFAVLPALWLPWTFLPLLAPWHKLLGSGVISGLRSARHGEKQGLAFVWITFLSGLALLSLIHNKQPLYLVPLLGPLAVISGRAVLGLSPVRGMLLQRFTAVLLFLLALCFVLLPVYYSGNVPSVLSWLESFQLPEWEIKLHGIFLLAVILLGAICLLIGIVKARRPESTLLIMLLAVTLFSYPMSTMTMPSLDKVLSSKDASVEIRRYAGLGYYPVSFGVYNGVFSYYSGEVIHETDDWAELDRLIAFNPKVVIAMSAKRWERWTLNPDLREIMRFWLFSGEYVLLLRNTAVDEQEPPLPGQAPEPEVAAPENSGRPDAPPVEQDMNAAPDTGGDNPAQTESGHDGAVTDGATDPQQDISGGGMGGAPENIETGDTPPAEANVPGSGEETPVQ